MPGLPKKLHNIDIQIGQRLRELRIRRNISQTKLAEMLGLSFQQIQKYEKGATRLAASTLWYISERLDAPINWFFEGLEKKAASKELSKIRPGDSVFYQELSKLPTEIRNSLRVLIRQMSKKR